MRGPTGFRISALFFTIPGLILQSFGDKNTSFSDNLTPQLKSRESTCDCLQISGVGTPTPKSDRTTGNRDAEERRMKYLGTMLLGLDIHRD